MEQTVHNGHPVAATPLANDKSESRKRCSCDCSCQTCIGCCGKNRESKSGRGGAAEQQGESSLCKECSHPHCSMIGSLNPSGWPQHFLFFLFCMVGIYFCFGTSSTVVDVCKVSIAIVMAAYALTVVLCKMELMHCEQQQTNERLHDLTHRLLIKTLSQTDFEDDQEELEQYDEDRYTNTIVHQRPEEAAETTPTDPDGSPLQQHSPASASRQICRSSTGDGQLIGVQLNTVSLLSSSASCLPCVSINEEDGLEGTTQEQQLRHDSEVSSSNKLTLAIVAELGPEPAIAVWGDLQGHSVVGKEKLQ